MFNTETIYRVHKNKNYTTMCNTHLNDEHLSLKAIGLHSFILSKPDNWKIIIQNIINSHTDGRESVYSGIRELINLGYWVKYPVRKNGKIFHYQTDIYEEPQPKGQRRAKVEYLLDLCRVTYDSGKTEYFNLDGTPANEISREEMLESLHTGNPEAEEKKAESLLSGNPNTENHNTENKQLLNTDTLNTDISSTEHTVPSNRETFFEEMKQQLKYDALLENGLDPDILKTILDVVADICFSTAPTVKLNRRQTVALSVVRSRYLSLTDAHIISVYNTLMHKGQTIFNLRRYLTSALYTAAPSLLPQNRERKHRPSYDSAAYERFTQSQEYYDLLLAGAY